MADLNKYKRLVKQQFLEACEQNNIQKVKSCIARIVDINCLTEDGLWWGLRYAAEKNHVELCQLLLSQPNIDVNKKDKNNMTCLMIACFNGYVEITRMLCNAPGIDLNCKDHFNGYTAATWAANMGYIDCLRVLATTRGVDWNARDNVLDTVSMKMVTEDNREVLEVLKDIPDIDWNLKDVYWDTVLSRAIKNNSMNVIEVLKNIPNLEIKMDHLKDCKLAGRLLEAFKIKVQPQLRIPECPVSLEIMPLNFSLLLFL